MQSQRFFVVQKCDYLFLYLIVQLKLIKVKFKYFKKIHGDTNLYEPYSVKISDRFMK